MVQRNVLSRRGNGFPCPAEEDPFPAGTSRWSTPPVRYEVLAAQRIRDQHHPRPTARRTFGRPRLRHSIPRRTTEPNPTTNAGDRLACHSPAWPTTNGGCHQAPGRIPATDRDAPTAPGNQKAKKRVPHHDSPTPHPETRLPQPKACNGTEGSGVRRCLAHADTRRRSARAEDLARSISRPEDQATATDDQVLVNDQGNHAGSREARTAGVWGVAPQNGTKHREGCKATEQGGRGGS
jgi:hypothetical protein